MLLQDQLTDKWGQWQNWSVHHTQSKILVLESQWCSLRGRGTHQRYKATLFRLLKSVQGINENYMSKAAYPKVDLGQPSNVEKLDIYAENCFM